MSENNEPKGNLLRFENRYWTDSKGVDHKYPTPEPEFDPPMGNKERIGCWSILLALVVFWYVAYKLFMWWLS